MSHALADELGEADVVLGGDDLCRFSPIMMQDALVFLPITDGMTLASATRNLPTPVTRSRGSTTSPIRQVDVG